MPSELGSVLRRQFSRFDEIVAFLDKAKPSAPYYSAAEVSEALGIPDQSIRGVIPRLILSGHCARLEKGPIFSAPKFIKKLENSRAKKPA